MEKKHLHPSDEELLLHLDGEAAPNDSKRVQAHLAACWECRARFHDFESAITEFTRFHMREFESLPSSKGPRALLKAQLSQLSSEKPKSFHWPFSGRQAVSLIFTSVGVLTVTILVLFVLLRRPADAAVVSTPNAMLTPGATVLADRRTICISANVKNKEVSAALQKRVFEEYGIRGATPKFYEVDYLVTPALGGADDIRNLWPHSYSTAWNAKVKDNLEDRLRHMVCAGELDLGQAQREIAADWIAAYKKYFQTDKPLPVQ